jgi:broad specificity phosphatase PhoE
MLVNPVESTLSPELVEYHCGRLQGLTRAQGEKLAKEEGITFQEFKKQGGREVNPGNAPMLTQSVTEVYARVRRFWEREILPKRATQDTILVISHAGLITSMFKYFAQLKYSKAPMDAHSQEFNNCSITEVEINHSGAGEFLRVGDWTHIFTAMHLDPNEELEDSTGGPPT